jgi:hypothetical protein
VALLTLRTYVVRMGIRAILRKIGRKLTPPGNRQPLDETYRQPRMDPEHQMSGASERGKTGLGGGV